MERFTPAPPDESDLISRAQRGDLDAFNDLILLHQDALFNIALRTLGDEDRAADAVQDALISAFRSLHTFHGGSFRAWLARTVVNKCYDEYRRSSRHPSIPLMPIMDGEEVEDGFWLCDPSPSLEDRFDNSELDQALQHCMKSLPAALRIPVGTVKSRLARARAAMRISMQRFAHVLPSAYQTLQPLMA
jgi:RNA polymerase sigma-70 factor, ECF subfamily